MPDRSIDEEIRENQQRQAENEAREDDDGSIVDSLEKAVNPVVDTIDSGDDAPYEEDLEQRRELNDAEHRPRQRIYASIAQTAGSGLPIRPFSWATSTGQVDVNGCLILTRGNGITRMRNE